MRMTKEQLEQTMRALTQCEMDDLTRMAHACGFIIMKRTPGTFSAYLTHQGDADVPFVLYTRDAGLKEKLAAVVGEYATKQTSSKPRRF